MNTPNNSTSTMRAQTPEPLGVKTETLLRILAAHPLVRLFFQFQQACVENARRRYPEAEELTDDQVWRYLC